jgi:hypothetical protein
MSQFSPPPSPPGDPMGNAPQGSQFPGGPKQGNGLAITSLIVGILGCIPCLPLVGILAIPFGFFGLRKTKNPQVGGKGLALTGLILGLLSTIGWVIFGIVIYSAYNASLPLRPQGVQFLTDMSNNKLDAAQKESTLTQKEIEELYTDDFKGWGAYQSMNWQMSFSMSANAQAGGGYQKVCTLMGTATFANSSHMITILMGDNGSGWKVVRIAADKPMTPP